MELFESVLDLLEQGLEVPVGREAADGQPRAAGRRGELEEVKVITGDGSELDAEVIFKDTVCQPTKARQQALDRLCAAAEFVLVVGGILNGGRQSLAFSGVMRRIRWTWRLLVGDFD